ncbi:MAG: small basic protein [Candidatus Omnitrophica bacterium]|nr:small basic protein [Candidatus Omnitrophota bacterium]
MSIHSSLKSAATMKRHRSVLSRLERVRLLQEEGDWDLEKSSILGLPKVKHLKIRVRKEKAAAPAAGTAAPGTAAGAAAPAAPASGKAAAKAPSSPKAPASAKAAGAQAKPEAGAPAKKKE